LGIAVQIKDRCAAKVIDNYRHTNTCIAVIPSDKTCVEFYNRGTGSTIIIMNKPS
jgi:hypothetical protein